MKYGRLTVIGKFKKKLYGKNRTFCKCICDCGNYKEVLESSLKSGNTKSCGCYNRDLLIARNTKHGKRYHPAYDTWNAMMARCYNKNDDNYKWYGARGIQVVDEWHNVANFTDWCDSNGFQKNLQLDRIDNDGNYGPNNCRYVKPIVNLRNTRHNVFINGKALREYLDEIGEKRGIGFPTLRYRYYTITKEGLEPTEYNLIDNPRWIRKSTC